MRFNKTKTKSLFLLTFLLLTFTVTFPFNLPTVKAQTGWLNGWQYRKAITITGSSAGSVTNYQIRLKVHYSSQGFSQVWDSGNIASGSNTDTDRKILVDGDYLYGVSKDPQKLVIYDISNPSSPVQKSLTSLGRYAIDIRKKGNYLFISTLGATDGGVDVYDVSDPTSPSYVTRLNLGGHCHGMFLSGDYLYVCMHYDDKFQIVDVSDPTNPVAKGSLSGSTYFNGCHDVYVDGNYAYVTNYLSGTGQYGFVVVDVSDKDNPSVVGYTGEGHKNSHIFKVGNYFYVGSHGPDSGLRIYNVNNPSSPSYEGQYFTSEGISFGYWIDDYNSTMLGAVCQGSNRLYLIDISNPTEPSIKTSVLVGSNSNPRYVAITGNYFYVSWTDESNYEWHIRSYQLTTLSDSGENVYLNGHCRTDFGDIRFTDDDGVTELDYWIEEKVDSDYAVFWVEVPSILSDSNATIYIYYGKSDTTTTSNGDKTFLLFDDFEGSAGSSPNSSKWTVYKQGSSNAIVELDGDGNLHLAGEANVISSGNVKSIDTFTHSFLIKLKHKIDEEHYANVAIGSGSLQDVNGGNSDWHFTTLGKGYIWRWTTPVSGGGSRDFEIDRTPEGSSYTRLMYHDGGDLTTLNEWHELEYIYDQNGKLSLYHDGSLMDSIEATDTTYLNDDKNILLSQGEYSSGVGGNRYIDYVFVRKYVDPEPAILSWGNEENLGSGEQEEWRTVENWSFILGSPFWRSVETWNLIFGAPGTWSLVESWSLILSLEGLWNLIESWNFNLNSPGFWSLVENWSFYLSSPGTWNLAEAWNFNLFSQALWNFVEAWNFNLNPPGVWHTTEIWNFKLFSEALWKIVETWQFTLYSQALWNLVESWNFYLSSPGTWSHIEKWTLSILTGGIFNPVETWQFTFQSSGAWINIEKWIFTLLSHQAAVWNIIEKWLLNFNLTGWRTIETWTFLTNPYSPWHLVETWSFVVQQSIISGILTADNVLMAIGILGFILCILSPTWLVKKWMDGDWYDGLSVAFMMFIMGLGLVIVWLWG